MLQEMWTATYETEDWTTFDVGGGGGVKERDVLALGNKTGEDSPLADGGGKSFGCVRLFLKESCKMNVQTRQQEKLLI